MHARRGHGPARLVGIPVAILAVVALVLPGATGAASTAISLSPTQTTAGSSVSVTGTGFARRTNGTIAFDGSTVGTFATNGGGNFSTTFTVPASAGAGAHTVRATVGSTSASATLTIVAPTPPPSPTPTAAPTATLAPTATPAPISPSPSPSSSSATPSATPGPSPTAVTGDIGVRGPAYPSSVLSPTGQKPQSKLWYAGGSWWGDLWDATANAFAIHRYDWATDTWIPTGVVIDGRPDSSADVLWDGSHLVVLTHRSDQSNSTTPPTSGDLAMRILRFSYDGAAGSYSLDAGFPVTIANVAVEAAVIDRDSTGALWATWTYSDGGPSRNVFVTHSTTDDAHWVAPFVPPVSGAKGVKPDDISGLVAYSGRIGLMWSNQNADTMYFASHRDGDPDTTWSLNPAVQGPHYADDHLSLRSLQADTSGRVFAAVKTSLDALGPGTQQPLILFLWLDSTGSWHRSTFGTVADDHTRPIVMLDAGNQQAYVLAAAPNRIVTVNGVTVAGGTVYYKSTPLSNPSFPSGLGTAFIQRTSDTASLVNNATSTKQSVDGSTGLLVLASDDGARIYMSNKLTLPGGPAPTPAPTPTPTPSPTSSATPAPSATPTPTPTPSPSASPDLRAEWLLDEGSGTTLTDSSGLGNDAALHGGTAWVAGVHGSAVRFDDAAGGYATAPDAASLDVSGGLTLATWVRPEWIATQYLIKKATASVDGYELSLASTGKAFFRLDQASNGNTYRIDSTSTYPSNGSTWVHLAATYDGTTMRLYVNGVLQASAPGPASIATNGLALALGAAPDATYFLRGTLDEPRVWARALSASEIAALASP